MNGLRHITTPLWPIRYKPFEDELLSCWLVRLAHGHGMKVQTFCNLLFGSKRQVWNRDIDRLAPLWLIEEISLRTGTPLSMVYATTLRSYEGRLFTKAKTSGALPWIQSLKIYHRKRQGFGLQYCSACLAEGAEPYFRKRWRVTLNTMCDRHQCMLRDRCPSCAAGVVFHRTDIGQGSTLDFTSLAQCHVCGFDLRQAPIRPVVSYDDAVTAWHGRLCSDLSHGVEIDLEMMRTLHHLVSLLLSRYKVVHLREHVCSQLGIADIVQVSERISVESRSMDERHLLVQLGAWLLLDLASRLRNAWRSKAVRYNHLLKDFDDAPQFYAEVVAEFSDWREGEAGRHIYAPG